ncbi:unnamed protein product [Tuber aestivum]|uniref:non-specific serine/threonine protein kinase n=1 Tax=Tuber aestivum TaxID=59557 RepID=A0A292Q0P8_9PEZI|nr:unnamed protein product [Tuber aestivum]
MSPARVKLGGFSLSKQVQDGDLTTYHTRFFVGSYTAPEVLGLNLVSETPGYTNAVDTWSIGCVIYELLTGEILFSTAKQISRYFIGKCGFPDDRLKSLSPPINDTGISLINSMVSLQPGARPSALDALNDKWITDLMSELEDGGGEGGGGSRGSRGGEGGEFNNGRVVIGDRNGERNNGQETGQNSLRTGLETLIHHAPPIPYPGVPLLPEPRGKGSKPLLHKWLAHIASFWKGRDSRKASKDEKRNEPRIGSKKRDWGIKLGFPRGQKVKSPDV